MRATTITLACLALAAILLLPAGAARALTIDFTRIAGDSLTDDQLAAFTTAAGAWERVLRDDVTVNLSIGFTALAAGVLGQTTPAERATSLANIDTRLTADRSSAADGVAVAHLPAPAATQIVVTTAQARAMGFTTPGATSDGTIEFNSGFGFATARNGDGGIPAGVYDLVGIVEHEIGHALGFLSGVGGTLQSVLDLFRFQTGGTAASFSTGQAAGFSIDGGATDLAGFSTGADYQASHWLNASAVDGASLLMDPAIGAGQVQNIQPVDLLALDVIGWDVVAVPEPGSAAMLLAAVLGLARRRFSRGATRAAAPPRRPRSQAG